MGANSDNKMSVCNDSKEIIKKLVDNNIIDLSSKNKSCSKDMAVEKNIVDEKTKRDRCTPSNSIALVSGFISVDKAPGSDKNNSENVYSDKVLLQNINSCKESSDSYKNAYRKDSNDKNGFKNDIASGDSFNVCNNANKDVLNSNFSNEVSTGEKGGNFSTDIHKKNSFEKKINNSIDNKNAIETNLEDKYDSIVGLEDKNSEHLNFRSDGDKFVSDKNFLKNINDFDDNTISKDERLDGFSFVIDKIQDSVPSKDKISEVGKNLRTQNIGNSQLSSENVTFGEKKFLSNIERHVLDKSELSDQKVSLQENGDILDKNTAQNKIQTVKDDFSENVFKLDNKEKNSLHKQCIADSSSNRIKSINNTVSKKTKCVEEKNEFYDTKNVNCLRNSSSLFDLKEDSKNLDENPKFNDLNFNLSKKGLNKNNTRLFLEKENNYINATNIVDNLHQNGFIDDKLMVNKEDNLSPLVDKKFTKDLNINSSLENEMNNDATAVNFSNEIEFNDEMAEDFENNKSISSCHIQSDYELESGYDSDSMCLKVKNRSKKQSQSSSPKNVNTKKNNFIFKCKNNQSISEYNHKNNLQQDLKNLETNSITENRTVSNIKNIKKLIKNDTKIYSAINKNNNSHKINFTIKNNNDIVDIAIRNSSKKHNKDIIDINKTNSNLSVFNNNIETNKEICNFKNSKAIMQDTEESRFNAEIENNTESSEDMCIQRHAFISNEPKIKKREMKISDHIFSDTRVTIPNENSIDVLLTDYTKINNKNENKPSLYSIKNKFDTVLVNKHKQSYKNLYLDHKNTCIDIESSRNDYIENKYKSHHIVKYSNKKYLEETEFFVHKNNPNETNSFKTNDYNKKYNSRALSEKIDGYGNRKNPFCLKQAYQDTDIDDEERKCVKIHYLQKEMNNNDSKSKTKISNKYITQRNKILSEKYYQIQENVDRKTISHPFKTINSYQTYSVDRYLNKRDKKCNDNFLINMNFIDSDDNRKYFCVSEKNYYSFFDEKSKDNDSKKHRNLSRNENQPNKFREFDYDLKEHTISYNLDAQADKNYEKSYLKASFDSEKTENANVDKPNSNSTDVSSELNKCTNSTISKDNWVPFTIIEPHRNKKEIYENLEKSNNLLQSQQQNKIIDDKETDFSCKNLFDSEYFLDDRKFTEEYLKNKNIMQNYHKHDNKYTKNKILINKKEEYSDENLENKTKTNKNRKDSEEYINNQKIMSSDTKDINQYQKNQKHTHIDTRNYDNDYPKNRKLFPQRNDILTGDKKYLEEQIFDFFKINKKDKTEISKSDLERKYLDDYCKGKEDLHYKDFKQESFYPKKPFPSDSTKYFDEYNSYNTKVINHRYKTYRNTFNELKNYKKKQECSKYKIHNDTINEFDVFNKERLDRISRDNKVECSSYNMNKYKEGLETTKPESVLYNNKKVNRSLIYNNKEFSPYDREMKNFEYNNQSKNLENYNKYQKKYQNKVYKASEIILDDYIIQKDLISNMKDKNVYDMSKINRAEYITQNPLEDDSLCYKDAFKGHYKEIKARNFRIDERKKFSTNLNSSKEETYHEIESRNLRSLKDLSIERNRNSLEPFHFEQNTVKIKNSLPSEDIYKLKSKTHFSENNLKNSPEKIEPFAQRNFIYPIETKTKWIEPQKKILHNDKFEQSSPEPHKINKGPWSKEEDETLLGIIKTNGPKNWSQIAKQIKTRIGKQCRERWHNHLHPGITKKPFTVEEDMLIKNLHKKLGNRWSEIAKYMPGRTDNAIKNHWNSSLVKKINRSMSLNEIQHQKEVSGCINVCVKKNGVCCCLNCVKDNRNRSRSVHSKSNVDSDDEKTASMALLDLFKNV